MKKKSTSKSAFFNLRVLIASILCLFGVFVALLGSGAFAQTKGTKALNNLLGQMRRRMPPVRRLRTSDEWSVRSAWTRICEALPYVAPKRGVRGETADALSALRTDGSSAPSEYGISGLKYVQALLKNLWRPTPTMPGPLFTFEGNADTCGCQPP